MQSNINASQSNINASLIKKKLILKNMPRVRKQTDRYKPPIHVPKKRGPTKCKISKCAGRTVIDNNPCKRCVGKAGNNTGTCVLCYQHKKVMNENFRYKSHLKNLGVFC